MTWSLLLSLSVTKVGLECTWVLGHQLHSQGHGHVRPPPVTGLHRDSKAGLSLGDRGPL